MTTYRQILVATDFSPASGPALDLALRMAGLGKTVLLVANAWEEPHLPDLSFAHARLYTAYEQTVRSKAAAELDRLVERARAQGVDARPLLLAGFADEAIVASARQQKADLIVMGTHGRRGTQRFLLGSVAANVVAATDCPVITVCSADGPARGSRAKTRGKP